MPETNPEGETDEFSTADLSAASPDELITSEPLATSSKTMRANLSATGNSASMLAPKRKKMPPPRIANCYWRADTGGWQLRSSKRNADYNNPYIGHLSDSAYKKLKSEHKGKDLISALCEWAESKAAEKGIEL